MEMEMDQQLEVNAKVTSNYCKQEWTNSQILTSILIIIIKYLLSLSQKGQEAEHSWNSNKDRIVQGKDTDPSISIIETGPECLANLHVNEAKCSDPYRSSEKFFQIFHSLPMAVPRKNVPRSRPRCGAQRLIAQFGQTGVIRRKSRIENWSFRSRRPNISRSWSKRCCRKEPLGLLNSGPASQDERRKEKDAPIPVPYYIDCPLKSADVVTTDLQGR